MVRSWTIWDELRHLQNEMDRLFNTFFTADATWGARPLLTGPEGGSELVPVGYRQALTDLTETDKEFIATIELPGVEKQDIQVNATDDGVEVKVERKEEKKEEDKKKGTYRLERSYAGFYRFIPVPDGVDTENIKATYKNGVLELKMPKVASKKKGKHITVE